MIDTSDDEWIEVPEVEGVPDLPEGASQLLIDLRSEISCSLTEFAPGAGLLIQVFNRFVELEAESANRMEKWEYWQAEAARRSRSGIAGELNRTIGDLEDQLNRSVQREDELRTRVVELEARIAEFGPAMAKIRRNYNELASEHLELESANRALEREALARGKQIMKLQELEVAQFLRPMSEASQGRTWINVVMTVRRGPGGWHNGNLKLNEKRFVGWLPCLPDSEVTSD